MALTDLYVPLTAKKIGPGPAPAREARPKVHYLKPSDVSKIEPDTVGDNTIIYLKYARTGRKVAVFETPDEYQGAIALSQGATANPNFVKNWKALTPTSSATQADMSTGAGGGVANKYINDVTTINGGYVLLPDPFVKRLVTIHNQTTGSINVVAVGTTASINGSTAPYVITTLKRIHFLAPTAATAGTTAGWKTAIDV